MTNTDIAAQQAAINIAFARENAEAKARARIHTFRMHQRAEALEAPAVIMANRKRALLCHSALRPCLPAMALAFAVIERAHRRQRWALDQHRRDAEQRLTSSEGLQASPHQPGAAGGDTAHPSSASAG